MHLCLFQLAHPVLSALASTERKWLVELLYAFNSGNLFRFQQLRTQWSKQPDLAQHEVAMRQKISLLCLMEVTWKFVILSLLALMYCCENNVLYILDYILGLLSYPIN